MKPVVPRSLAVVAGAVMVSVGCGGDEPREGGAAGEGVAEAVVEVAVTANMAAAHRELARRFESASGYRVRSSLGSTGQLYGQIANGAPFDVFLAADRERPRLLEEGGLAVPGSRFTYARGRLALFAPGRDARSRGLGLLRDDAVRRIAVANPRTAPYGAAAVEVLQRLGLWQPLEARMVRGESVAQAFQFVKSGGAEVGLVALAQVADEPPDAWWVVPDSLHRPIRQDAVLLEPGRSSRAADSYLRFLRSGEAAAVLEARGYEPGGAPGETAP